ncbi:MCE family protein [Adhaeribacter arboris]|uniref:MCE family protein n=1 Tax=Adhaeribacter arboris TaxID=2072846 RepID=A0A2T2YGN2_9BACT|nr:MlaD family protein [Adhaeribacter arboris]PSR54650.1 MCE family protein [Adhaeribacter arboris]
MGVAENKRSVLVGIFILLAIIIFVSGVFLLGGQQKRFVNSINIKAVFDDVAGLKPGNNVWFSGVKIGTVKTINFYGESQVEITMSIEDKVRQYIRKDSKARISSESLIGNRIIVLFGGSPQAAPVEENDRVLAENPLNTDDVVETLQENNKNLVGITRDFKTLSTRLVQGQGTMGAILKDSTMADNFRAVVSNLKQASATTVRATGALAAFTNKLNTPDGLASKFLTDTLVFRRLENSVAQIQRSTAAAADITNNLKQVSSKLNSDSNAVGVFLNDAAFADQLRNTMTNLESSTDELDETLKAIQNNFFLKGYFRRKAIRDAREAAKQKEEAAKQKEKAQGK